jgi:hypothetical protein
MFDLSETLHYTDCIYRKIDKTSKGQTLWNGFAHIENDITIG